MIPDLKNVFGEDNIIIADWNNGRIYEIKSQVVISWNDSSSSTSQRAAIELLFL